MKNKKQKNPRSRPTAPEAISKPAVYQHAGQANTSKAPPPRSVNSPPEKALADLAGAEQLRQLANWIGARKDELQDKFDNMSEGAQEGDRGQEIQEQIEALESAEGSIDDAVTEEALLNIIGELEGSGIKIPKFNGGTSKKSGTTAQVPDNGDGQVKATKEINPAEVLSQAEGLKRFKELDRLIIAGLTQSLIASKALRAMAQGHYYTFGGFKSIAEYGREAMKLAESTVHQYVNAGRVATLIDDSTDCRVKPVNEAQLRPLLNVNDDKEVIEIWKTATLHGEGSLTEKAVAKAKRMVLKQQPTKPTDTGVEQVAKKIHNAIRRGWDTCQGARGKLLGKVLLVLKGLYDELDYADRSPRLTTIFKHIEMEEPEPAAKTRAEVQPAAKREPDKGTPTKAISARGFWAGLNWELGNADLAEIWHKKEQTLRNMRCRFKCGAAVKCEPEQYREKLAKEKAKAAGEQDAS